MYEKLREPQVAYRPKKHGDRNERGAYAIVSWYDGYVVARRRRRRSARDHVWSSSSSSSSSRRRRRRRRREPRRCRRVRVREDFASRPLHRRRWRPSRNALHQSFFCFATMMITPKSSTKIVIDFRSSLSNRRRRRPQGTTKARRPVQNRKRRRRRRRHRESSNRSKKNVVVVPFFVFATREIFL